MAGYSYFKRGNWGWNPNKRWRGSTVTSRAYGNYRAAKQQKDRLEFTINTNYPMAAAYNPETGVGVASVNVWEVLLKNSNFNNFKNAFDQVRIDAIRVKLNITNTGNPYNENLYNVTNNLSVYTAWDRNGLDINQVEFFTSSGQNVIKIPEDNYDTAAVYGYRNIIGKGIVNASSSSRSTYNPFRQWTRNLKLDLSGVGEKCDFINTSSISQFADTNKGNLDALKIVNDRYSNNAVNDIISDGNPAMPFECASCRFKPTLLVGVFSTTYSNTNGGQINEFAQVGNPVVFQAEWSVVCTFKAMKPGT